MEIRVREFLICVFVFVSVFMLVLSIPSRKSTVANDTPAIPPAFVVESGPEILSSHPVTDCRMWVIKHKENGERFLVVSDYHGVSVTQILPVMR